MQYFTYYNSTSGYSEFVFQDSTQGWVLDLGKRDAAEQFLKWEKEKKAQGEMYSFSSHHSRSLAV